MESTECKLEMPVRFGRPLGEQTIGRIVSLRPLRCHIETLESRGDGPIGELWTVPYAYVEMVGEDEVPVHVPLTYNPFDERNGCFEVLLECYRSLSPERLSLDGFRPPEAIRQQEANLRRRIRKVQASLNMQISESELYAWDVAKQAYLADAHKPTKSEKSAKKSKRPNKSLALAK